MGDHKETKRQNYSFRKDVEIVYLSNLTDYNIVFKAEGLLKLFCWLQTRNKKNVGGSCFCKVEKNRYKLSNDCILV